ncbi:kinase-like protein [Eremomyces bilateralis CBS 781.70]|uniref:mitogen-activated protein kinase kinase n=1 Tax=Eremomyces bilateralis CBS 781.70 TaxID=1392243 RepID=A0A6G1G218_9PEZI|nr:kinase-like protein [Eremomyces bilateralis CBS 781.70]KAF1811849.1 kinase-like protein [Eremomyces bilateralis CBS 781.70]
MTSLSTGSPAPTTNDVADNTNSSNQHPPHNPPDTGPSALPTTSESTNPPSLSAQMDATPPPISSPSPSSSTGRMTPSFTPLANLNAARRPPGSVDSSGAASDLKSGPDLLAKMKAFHLERRGAPPGNMAAPGTDRSAGGSTGEAGVPPARGPQLGPGGVPSSFNLPHGVAKPGFSHFQSAPAVPRAGGPKKPSLAEKRGMALPGGVASNNSPGPLSGAGRKKPGLSLAGMNESNDASGAGDAPTKPNGGSMLDRYSEFLDAKTGSLRFKGKAVLTSQGIEFAGGSAFSISLDEVDTLDELGKGNYGTVYKVKHARPKIRRPGLGLAGNRMHSSPVATPPRVQSDEVGSEGSVVAAANTTTSSGTGIIMAMKEIRLELDDAKFAAIIMELDILHRCISPYIIDFYGAFFQEGAVYICIEFMDGGSIDKLYGDGIPETVLRKIALATIIGLKTLKDDHNIIHRDVKPTNILVNTRGQVKICDFGVSGNLVASIAKTNIGCQSYMAPERISSGGVVQAGANPGGGTYSVQSDIWSLGLTIIECAMGCYPYPPDTYNNIFSQLSAIVDGDPPDLPEEGFSDAARHFVRSCLNKVPMLRPSYAALLQHPWLKILSQPEVIPEEEEEETSKLAAEPDSDQGPDTDEDELRLVSTPLQGDVHDQEVADWVVQALEKRKDGLLGKQSKPALHAVALDAVESAHGGTPLGGLFNVDDSSDRA